MLMEEFDCKVKRTLLYEMVADKLEEIIFCNSLRVGEKLPSEQALANRFGVSRNVMRESLKLLKERNLVSLHNGEGIYIEKPKPRNIADVLQRIILSDRIDNENVTEMRMILETKACRLAAERNPASSFDYLEQINERMLQNKDDRKKRIQNDLDFHYEIARLSGNPLMEAFVESISDLLTRILDTALIPKEGNESGIQFHKQIIIALKLGNGELAERTMGEHLKESMKNYYTGNQALMGMY